MRHQYDVFVSYNRAQLRWVRRLVARLRSHGLRPFFDEEVGLEGTALAREIARALLDSRCCVIVLTPESVHSHWVGYEMQKAMHMDPDAMRRFVVPILLRDCDVPQQLTHIGYVDCRRGLTRRRLAELVRGITQWRRVRFEGDEPAEPWGRAHVPRSVDLAELAFVDEFHGWIVGDEGAMFQTTDAGRTWEEHGHRLKRSLYSVALGWDGRRGYVVGARGTVLATCNAGRTWRRIPSPVEHDILAVSFCDDQRAVCAVTSGGLILRRGVQDGSWQRVCTADASLWSIHFSEDGQLGCAAGSKGTLLLSRDGGRVWKRVAVTFVSPLYSATIMRNSTTICAVGDEGRILISRDAGRSWKDCSYRASLWESWLNASDFSTDGRTGWIVGTKGLMLKTSDGGRTWTPYVVEERPELVNVCYTANGTIWILGEGGTLLTTAAR